jgi:multidrug efflux pump subunit AcrB
VVAPLGLAVVFAMLASCGFSRTLTPIAIGMLLKGERHGGQAGRFARFHAASSTGSGACARITSRCFGCFGASCKTS